MSNVLEAISKLKLKNSKYHFPNLVLYLSAYSYTKVYTGNYIRKTCKTSCAVKGRLLT